MKIRLTDDGMKLLKKINKEGKSLALRGGLATMLLLSTLTGTTITAEATENQEIYDLNETKDYLFIDSDSNLDSITNIPTLKTIYMCDCTINNLDLSNTNVEHITLQDCKVTNIILPVSLNYLELDYTKLNDYDLLNNLPLLNSLHLQGLDFNDLSCLSKINTLNDLQFYKCNIGDLNGIEKLVNLKTLSFNNTGIEDITKLKGLGLNSLTLNYTYVQDLGPINNSNLKNLDISDSSNISPDSLTATIKSLPNLETLTTRNNEMSVTEELLTTLKTGHIKTTLTNNDLKIKNKVLAVFNNIIKDNMTDNDKIYAIVNYVINNLEYDYDVENDQDLVDDYNEHALEYALKGKGCCQNYAVFTNALLRLANIDSYEILGVANNTNHIWIYVTLEDKTYAIDPTWLDEETLTKITNSKNYMVNSDEFRDSHVSIFIPSSVYNNINNLKPTEESKEITTISGDTNENIPNLKTNLKYSGLGLAALTGILLALKKAYRLKKNQSQEKNNTLKK